MATLEPSALRWLADQWEQAIDSAAKRDDAATFAGIVGDRQHRTEGGYHISREDQVDAHNYSVADVAADKRGPSNLASALDIKMDDADMRLVTERLYQSWRDDTDHRLDNCRGINGTRDGVKAIRFDCQFGTLKSATSDHLWHVHLEILREYANDMATMRNVLSVVIAGGTHAQATSTIDNTGDDMAGGIPPTDIPLNGMGSFNVWPVNTGQAGHGQAWLNLGNDTNGADYAVRIWASKGDRNWFPLGSPTDGVLMLKSGQAYSLALADGVRVLSISRAAANKGAAVYAGHLTFCVEYGKPRG